MTATDSTAASRAADGTPVPSPAFPALASDSACDAAIAYLGEIDRQLAGIETTKTTAVAAAAKAAETEATPLIADRGVVLQSIETYAAEHRDRLTDGRKRKFAEFASGKVAWTKGRDTVEIDDDRKDKIVARLKSLGAKFARFFKVTEAPSKTAMKMATDAERKVLKKIPGIAFRDGVESFAVEPVAMPLADRPPAQEASGA